MTEDGRLGGVMSAFDPGQYVGAAKIEHLLKNLNTGTGQVGRMDGTSAFQRWRLNLRNQESFTDTRVQRTLDDVFNLHHNVSSARYEVDQTQLEIDRLEPLVESGAASTTELEKAKLANQQALKRLQGYAKRLGLKRQTADLSGRYADAAMKTAAAAYQQAVEANRKVPGSVPDEELRKMSLDVEQRRLEIHLVQQTLELIEEIAAEMDANDDSPTGAADDDESASDTSSASVPSGINDPAQRRLSTLYGYETNSFRQAINERNFDPFKSIRESDQPSPHSSNAANSSEIVVENVQGEQALIQQVEQWRADILIAKNDLEKARSELARIDGLAAGGVASTSGIQNAERAVSELQLKLKSLQTRTDTLRNYCTFKERYVQSAFKVAEAARDKAVQANKKVPEAVSESEIRKLELDRQYWELQLEYVRQALELLKQTEDDLNSVETERAAPIAPNETAAPTENDDKAAAKPQTETTK